MSIKYLNLKSSYFPASVYSESSWCLKKNPTTQQYTLKFPIIIHIEFVIFEFEMSSLRLAKLKVQLITLQHL